MKKSPEWSFYLKLHRYPTGIPMERLAEYIRQFALLIGKENDPSCIGIKIASTGVLAKVPADREWHARQRILSGKRGEATSASKHLKKIEQMLGEDDLPADVIDASDEVLYPLRPAASPSDACAQVVQKGHVDGVVTGLRGADATMHLYLRDCFDRDLTLTVRKESVARDLLKHFRSGIVRLFIHGTWTRTTDGWLPVANKCVVDDFHELDTRPLDEAFIEMGKVEGNQWHAEADPLAFWASLRGISP